MISPTTARSDRVVDVKPYPVGAGWGYCVKYGG